MKKREIKLNIKNINDLLKLGESNVLTPAQYLIVVQSCKPFIGIFLNDYDNTLKMAKILEEYWDIWKQATEKPLFFDN